MAQYRKRQLPPGFYDHLLACQIQFHLSHPPSKQIIRSLLMLYSEAFQYFESLKNPKYVYFQIKMKEVFTSATVLMSLQDEKQENKSTVSCDDRQQNKIKRIQIRMKQQQMRQQMLEDISRHTSTPSLQRMIAQSQEIALRNLQKAQRQIDSQNLILQMKIKSRKSKSFSFKSLIHSNGTKESLCSEESLANLEDVINENDAERKFF